MLYTIKGILHSVAPMTNNRQLAIWLLSVSTLIVVLIVYGGWVRLTRSGLSIVEWNVVTGIVPPIGTEAWASEFAKYQQTPEYQIVNYGMQLDEFKFIYYMEFGHRLLGRVAGLLFAVPLFYLLFRHALPRAHIASYLGIGLRTPIVSWGVLLQEAQNVRTIAAAPWLLLPGGAVIIAVLALNFLGDGLRDAADPYAD